MFQESASVVENMTKVIDMERSGATIAYDYFREKIRERTMASGSELVPESKIERVNQLFRYIEDADLWRWALPNSKAFHSGFNDIKLEFNVNLNTELFNQLLELDPQCIIRQGQASLLSKQKLIDDILEQSYEIALGGGSLGHCLAVNADSISNLRSELGHQLANKSANQKLRGIGAVVYKVPDLENDQLLKISLRSIEIEDTTVISQKYGGGGHRNASSFMLSSSKFESWKVRNGLVAY
ncbi:hypothetical protein QJS10_CPA01g00203 [Acorus calamus]|uniref:DHHA1 domain-containing protein n=1 Tax=Acorus calamus TaxID=4465 RepID=A0AAV9FH99_ACOCL|nr:hypothetical protein QJS10_CPA01g00203 [Acorus calamus]